METRKNKVNLKKPEQMEQRIAPVYCGPKFSIDPQQQITGPDWQNQQEYLRLQQEYQIINQIMPPQN